ncbi:MAG: DUF1684 domain-containing protein [Bacteroidetes bacterium]|nr:DUF1684 domain-containing protein [Bacteroidota bacterium]
MRALLLVFLCLGSALIARSQTSYTDSLLSWRKVYIETHDVLKTPEEQSFLRFYAPDSSFRAWCTVTRYADSPWFPMPTSGKAPKMARKYGLLTFRIHDTTLHLLLYQLKFLLDNVKTKDFLFVGFTDATSADETYGAGRYIDYETTDIRQDRLLLDFNKAYNPSCAYTTGFNCPIPPRENDLPIAVRAGEKNFGKKVH